MNAFATYVASQFEAGMLRYSKRLAIIEVAESLGIGRFEANLVIAAVQHQLGRSSSPPTRPVPARRWAAALLLTIGIQLVILLAVWNIFLRSH